MRVVVRSQVSWGGRGLREWQRGLIDRIRVPISSIGHKFPIHFKTSIVQATVKDDKVALGVREVGVGEYEVVADHVIAGTGYEVDVDRIVFIDKELASEIRRFDRAPRLSRHFESSVPGLYFMGPVAALSFGPLVRFVAGSEFAVGSLAGHLAFHVTGLGSLWRRLVARVPATANLSRVLPQTES